MNLTIQENSKNYAAQVIQLPHKVAVAGLDNLCEVTYQGNSCLVSKDSDENDMYLFFPAECKLNELYVSKNNLFRHSEKNEDTTKKSFFEDHGRVKAIKFKGVISSGFIIPLSSLKPLISFDFNSFKLGDEFTHIDGVEICTKYVRPREKTSQANLGRGKVIDDVVDSKFAPEHMDTSHLMKNIHKFDWNTNISVSYKLHGTSARYFNAPTKRKLNWKEKLAKWFKIPVIEEEYSFISASRRVIKSVDSEPANNKNHYYESGDLWSQVGEQYFNNQLNKGEAVYCEIIGKTYSGEAIQGGYAYGLDKPDVYIYRISNINPQGIEIDLTYEQMKIRCGQIGVKYCPELFFGRVGDFVTDYKIGDELDIETQLNDIFYKKLLEQPSILDPSVVEEGFCIRIEGYPRPQIFKIKSKKFLLHEGVLLDKEVVDIEEEQNG
jgi:hypothetical protein